jgi:hypothetical protein
MRERNLQLLKAVYQMGSGFQAVNGCAAHASRRALTRRIWLNLGE